MDWGCQSEHLRQVENPTVFASVSCAAITQYHRLCGLNNSLPVLEATSLRSRCQMGSILSQTMARILPCLFLASGSPRHPLACGCIPVVSANPHPVCSPRVCSHGCLLSGSLFIMTSSHTGLGPPYSSITPA